MYSAFGVIHKADYRRTRGGLQPTEAKAAKLKRKGKFGPEHQYKDQVKEGSLGRRAVRYGLMAGTGVVAGSAAKKGINSATARYARGLVSSKAGQKLASGVAAGSAVAGHYAGKNLNVKTGDHKIEHNGSKFDTYGQAMDHNRALKNAAKSQRKQDKALKANRTKTAERLGRKIDRQQARAKTAASGKRSIMNPGRTGAQRIGIATVKD